MAAVTSLFKKKNTVSRELDIRTPEGFRQMYDLYWEKVYAICYNSTGQMELAKCMTQDIFKSIWERKNTFVVEKSIEHYLVRSAKTNVAAHFRKQAIRNQHIDCAFRNYCGTANCTEESVAFSMLVQELGLLVEKLPCKCRSVFKMSREEGKSNKEIAKELDISERAVEYHISKAISFLKENLKEHTTA